MEKTSMSISLFQMGRRKCISLTIGKTISPCFWRTFLFFPLWQLAATAVQRLHWDAGLRRLRRFRGSLATDSPPNASAVGYLIFGMTWCLTDVYPLVLTNIAMENVHLQWIYQFKMVIFHSYVELPEGNVNKKNSRRRLDMIWFASVGYRLFFSSWVDTKSWTNHSDACTAAICIPTLMIPEATSK